MVHDRKSFGSQDTDGTSKSHSQSAFGSAADVNNLDTEIDISHFVTSNDQLSRDLQEVYLTSNMPAS
jgi:hypothetical protein